MLVSEVRRWGVGSETGGRRGWERTRMREGRSQSHGEDTAPIVEDPVPLNVFQPITHAPHPPTLPSIPPPIYGFPRSPLCARDPPAGDRVCERSSRGKLCLCVSTPPTAHSSPSPPSSDQHPSPPHSCTAHQHALQEGPAFVPPIISFKMSITSRSAGAVCPPSSSVSLMNASPNSPANAPVRQTVTESERGGVRRPHERARTSGTEDVLGWAEQGEGEGS